MRCQAAMRSCWEVPVVRCGNQYRDRTLRAQQLQYDEDRIRGSRGTTRIRSGYEEGTRGKLARFANDMSQNTAPELLSSLELGDSAKIKSVGGEGALRQHFLDMGIIPGAVITFEKYAPMGDPMQFTVHGYELTLRVDDAKRIEAEPLSSAEASRHVSAFDPEDTSLEIDHPGLGEGGRFHQEGEASPLSDDAVLHFALAGNQNCGKTTLFNQLTGLQPARGQLPGCDGRPQGAARSRGTPTQMSCDLPGIYSMSPYSSEEIVSRRFILEEKPQGIINIVDATNIERNLYLTMQLMELGIPDGARAQHDGRDAGQRRLHQGQRAREDAGHPGRPHFRDTQRRRRRARRRTRFTSRTIRRGPAVRTSATSTTTAGPCTAASTASCTWSQDHAEAAGHPAALCRQQARRRRRADSRGSSISSSMRRRRSSTSSRRWSVSAASTVLRPSPTCVTRFIGRVVLADGRQAPREHASTSAAARSTAS